MGNEWRYHRSTYNSSQWWDREEEEIKTAGVKKGKFAAEQVSLCYFCSSRVADHLRPEGLPGWIPDFEGRVCVQFYSQEEVDDKNTVSARG